MFSVWGLILLGAFALGVWRPCGATLTVAARRLEVGALALDVPDASRVVGLVAAVGGGPCRGTMVRRDDGAAVVAPRDRGTTCGGPVLDGAFAMGGRDGCAAVRRDGGDEGRAVGVERRGAGEAVRLGADRDGAALRRDGGALLEGDAVRREGAAERVVVLAGARAGCAVRAGAGDADRVRVC